MKVFFAASHRGKKLFDPYYRRIYQLLKKEDYQLIDDSIIVNPTEEFYKKLETTGHTAYVELYKRSMHLLQQADINVIDCSLHSLSMGFMIDKSLDFHKPTVALYLKDNEPFFLKGVKDDKLIVQEYNEKNLEEVLKRSLIKARNMRDKRFNMFMTDELLRYLDDAANREGVNKSTFIRNLLLEHRKKHG